MSPKSTKALLNRNGVIQHSYNEAICIVSAIRFTATTTGGSIGEDECSHYQSAEWLLQDCRVFDERNVKFPFKFFPPYSYTAAKLRDAPGSGSREQQTTQRCSEVSPVQTASLHPTDSKRGPVHWTNYSRVFRHFQNFYNFTTMPLETRS